MKKRSLLLSSALLLSSTLGSAAADSSSYVLRTKSGEFDIAVENGRAFLAKALAGDGAKSNFVLPAPPAAGGLWQLEFRPPGGEEDQTQLLTAQGTAPEIRATSGRSLTLRWKNLKLQNEAAVDVTVQIETVADSDLTDWRIEVVNRSKTLGLWTVKFPRFEGLNVTKDGELFAPFGTGTVERDPVMSGGYDGIYPQALCSMQFLGLTDYRHSLYLAACDPHGHVKGFNFTASRDRNQGLTYQTVQYPEDMGVPGKNYKQPYPMMVGIIPGDWYNAAKLYRQWVLKEADWMKGRPTIADRKDWPDWFKKLPVWIGYHGMTGENQQKAIELNEYLGVPSAVHLYHWHQIAFDTQYPDFWPPFGPALEFSRELQKKGMKIMPYLNCHLIDQASASWKNDRAERYIAKPAGNARAKTEVWASGESVKLTPLCPATRYWQQKYLPLIGQLVNEMNVDGIYLDQVGCVQPDLCFDPTHGHPLGGGCHWVEGYARMIENIRRKAQETGRFVFLTTESAAEPYDFDGFLRCNEGHPALTPIWMAVYSGYRASFGYYFELPEEWLPKLTQQYLQGIQLGWGALHTPCPPEAKAFLREVARARYAGSDYLAMGEMLRDPEVEGNFARFKASWKNFGTTIPIDWPAVRASLWRAQDGTLGLAFVNLAAEEQTAKFTLSDESVPGGKYALQAVYPPGLLKPKELTADRQVSFQLTLTPRSAGIVSLTPVK